MKSKSTKKMLCFILCLCLSVLSSCTDSLPDEASTEEDTSISSSITTTTTTNTTTATTTIVTTTATSRTKTENKTTATKQPTTTKKTTTTTGNHRDDDPDVKKLVALTFDDGPQKAVTRRILSTLEKHGAKATFFVVGNRADHYKNYITYASKLGCEIGSHTWSHKNLTELTESEIETEITDSVKKIESITKTPVTLVRPPEGAVDAYVLKNVKYPIIMWNVDSFDWKNRNEQKIYDEVMNKVSDGSIILMHDLYSTTADAVERLIPDLMAKGYKFVTVSELMRLRGIELKSGKRYSQANP